MGHKRFDKTDVIAVLLLLTGEKFFSSDRSRLSLAVFRACENSVVLRNEFHFTHKWPAPYSEELEGTLDLLHMSKILMTCGELWHYILYEMAQNYVRIHILPFFTPQEVSELTDAAKLVKSHCAEKCW